MEGMFDKVLFRRGIVTALRSHGLTQTQADQVIAVAASGYRQGLRGAKLKAYVKANGPAGIDWTKFMELVMMLLPLILKLLGL